MMVRSPQATNKKSALAPLKLALIVATAALTPRTAHSAQLDASITPYEALRPEYVPEWDSAPVQRDLELTYDSQLSETDNGARFKAEVQGLQPGDRLRVGPGRWSVNSFFQVDLQGTAAAPIRIIGAPGAILTRPNAGQNTINFGSSSATDTRYLKLRGFEVTGGSYGIRLQNVRHLWIDQCHVHHVAAVGIGANSHHTDHLFVTRSEVHHTGSTGEGLYLGGNNASVACSHAVIALNHVHDTGGSQGDGIELKQGSFGCLIAENVVHGTNYPGLIVYGTGGQAVNVIESNVIWDTETNPFQVQGEAIVRNNLVFARNGPALQSGPHQDSTTHLKIIGNTFIARDTEAAFLRSWNDRPGMVLANNVIYSETGEAVHINGGLAGVTVGGNVVLGPVWGAPSTGFTQGTGLTDFVDVTWDGNRRDARPSGQSALQHTTLARPEWTRDLTGAVRPLNPSAGALEPGTYGRYLGSYGPNSPQLRTRFSPAAGAPSFTVTVDNVAPFASVWLGAHVLPRPGQRTRGALHGSAVLIRSAIADAQGRAIVTVDSAWLPTTPGERLMIRSAARTSTGAAVARRLVTTAR